VRLKLAWSAGGTLWTAAVQILVIPLYARLVPVEVYGIVLFTLAVRGNALALAHGFRVAFGRAVVTTGRVDAAVPGLRRAFVAMGATVSLGLLLLAPAMATRWLQVPDARARDGSVALAWMALSCAAVWWASYWEAVLWGTPAHRGARCAACRGGDDVGRRRCRRAPASARCGDAVLRVPGAGLRCPSPGGAASRPRGRGVRATG
jgi:hypothetical protein